MDQRILSCKWYDNRSYCRNYEKFQTRNDSKITTKYNQVGVRSIISLIGIKREKAQKVWSILKEKKMKGKVEEDKVVDANEQF